MKAFNTVVLSVGLTCLVGCDDAPPCQDSVTMMTGCKGEHSVTCSRGAVLTVEKRDGGEVFAICHCPPKRVVTDMAVPRDMASPLRAVVR